MGNKREGAGQDKTASRTIALFLKDGVSLSYVTRVLEAFAEANKEIARLGGSEGPFYDVILVSEWGGPIKTSAGASVNTITIGQDNRCQRVILIGQSRTSLSPMVNYWLNSPGVDHVILGLNDGPALQLGEDDGGNASFPAASNSTAQLIFDVTAGDVGLYTASRIAAKLSLPSFSANATTERGPDKHGVRATVPWILNRLGDDLRLPTLAAKALMSERTFFRRFQEVIGETPARFVERMRTYAAADALLKTDLSLKAIAARAGFSTPAMMRRAFLRWHRQTPLQYREMRKKPNNIK